MYPCILFALRREAQPFYRHFPVRRRLRRAPCPAWLCGTSLERVLVMETGVGDERCGRALRWLTDSYLPGENLLQPLFLLAAGFAGSLREECRVGDVIVGTEVIDEHGGSWPRDPLLPEVEQASGHGWHGRVLSTAHMVSEPGEKRQLSQRFGAVAVDMESATIARFCAEAGIPFACVRAISDDVSARLSPRLAALLSGPEVRFSRLLSEVARSPRLVLELWRLARDTRKAAHRLARALLSAIGHRPSAIGQNQMADDSGR